MNDKDIDKAIREALESSAPELPESSPIRELFQIYRSPRGGWNLLATALTFLYLALAVWFAVAFFDAGSTRAQIAWATGFLAAFVAVGLIKVYLWMEMHQLALLREVKRLELQVAHLREGDGKAGGED